MPSSTILCQFLYTSNLRVRTEKPIHVQGNGKKKKTKFSSVFLIAFFTFILMANTLKMSRSYYFVSIFVRQTHSYSEKIIIKNRVYCGQNNLNFTQAPIRNRSSNHNQCPNLNHITPQLLETKNPGTFHGLSGNCSNFQRGLHGYAGGNTQI